MTPHFADLKRQTAADGEAECVDSGVRVGEAEVRVVDEIGSREQGKIFRELLTDAELGEPVEGEVLAESLLAARAVRPAEAAADGEIGGRFLRRESILDGRRRGESEIGVFWPASDRLEQRREAIPDD